MEDLNKTQIILTALLLSFVTSIATGIVTFSLLEQAPPAVTQTIDRVVEKTVERVVSVPDSSNQTANVIKETIVVREDDKALEAIRKNVGAMVRIKGINAEGEEGVLRGIGILLDKQGTMITDSQAVAKGGSYDAFFENGEKIAIELIEENESHGLALLRPASTTTADYSYAILSTNPAVLGQKIISIGGRERNAVSTGIVSTVFEAHGSSTPSELALVGLFKGSTESKDIIPGSPILNLSGEIAGIRLKHYELEDRALFFDSKTILSILSKPKATSTRIQ